ncbi:hypothetical protein ACHBTE_06390 [Streptomyces sp. M41]|uniref:hypothetical protein n=1 Tax=Streptomyces sp. M41 TaxID=3059412 RepID=UPI00374D1394
MADEQYRWLDRETAERLLRGEPLEAVDAADRDQAERLAKTLESLTAEPPLSSAELPGEAAALAAFRAARADRDDVAMPVGHRPGSGASPDGDAGLVRLGVPAPAEPRPRWGRPLRLALAAALAVGMVGGVAVAAGTGALRTPFDEEEPSVPPAATVSAPVPEERPLVSPSPENTARDRGTAGATSPDPTGSGGARDAGPGDPSGDRESAGEEQDESSGGWWKDLASSCRDIREGKQLSLDRRRDLESAAGGSQRVRKYCKKVLKFVAEGAEAKWDKGGRDRDRDKGRDTGRGEDEDESGDRGDHGHDGNHWGGSHGDGRGDGDSGRGHGGNGRDHDGRDGKGHGSRGHRGNDHQGNGHGAHGHRGHDRRTFGAAQTPAIVTALLSDRLAPLTPASPRPAYRTL